MRKLCICLTSIILLFSSCKKNFAEQPVETGYNINLPSTNSIAGFTPVNVLSSSYLSETSLVSLTGLFGGDAPTSVSDGNLTVNFVSDFYKIDPSPFNWDGSWGVSPNVESPDPHALYNTATAPASLNLSKTVNTFGLELFWDGSVAFKVEFWNGSTLVGDVTKSFTQTAAMGQAFLFAATHPNGFNRIVFTPMAPTSFGFAIAQIRYAEIQAQTVHFDIMPGNCVNPFNTKSQGVIPVAIAGSANLNVNDIDLSTVRINGVAPSHKGFAKIIAPYNKTSDCDCLTTGSDNYNDLSLKFDKPSLAATFGNVPDGAQVTLTISGKLKNGTGFEGRDCVRIKN